VTSPLENTLGVVIGKRGRGTLTRVPRAVRQATQSGATLGTAHLGLGAGIVCAVQALFGFGVFLSHFGAYPQGAPAAFAWLLFAAVFVGAIIVFRTVGERLPTWLFAALVLALAAIVALDFVAIWSLGDIGGYATASVSAGFGLLFAITLRKPAEVITVAAVFGAAFVIAIVLTTPLDTESLPRQITAVSLAVLPAVIGVLVVRGFRRMVQVELDRVLVQSTVSAPRYAVGMLASEELARLDLAAEKLLESVATGRVALPLEPAIASQAASLATELRLHLIEGRRETWLHHAVTESELLGRSVTLTDQGSLAGLLDPVQRDGLLSAVWILLSESPATSGNRKIDLQLGPVNRTTQTAVGHRLVVPIRMGITGVSRNRIEPSTWSAISRVGNYTVSQSTGLTVEIECLVENPASQ
jgi:hypothetical protein